MKIANCIVLAKPKSRLIFPNHSKKIVKIVKTDGKIIELTSPTKVADFLANFHGYSLSISRNSSEFLPPSHELKIGSTYYLIPIPKKERKQQSVKRIKVVITKQQLQELLNKQKSVEEVLIGLKIKSLLSVDNNSFSKKKKTKLEAIPEDIES